jgi:hypothetical protein
MKGSAGFLGVAEWRNELSERKYFRTFEMCRECKILQHFSVEIFSPFKVLNIFIASWGEKEEVKSLSVTFVLEMHEFIIQIDEEEKLLRKYEIRQVKPQPSRQLLVHN